jgi:serine protease DegQ
VVRRSHRRHGVPGARSSRTRGLRRGDIIVAINGKSIADANALMTEAAALPPGSRGEIKILRDGKETVVAVEVGSRPLIRRAQ